MRMNRGLRTKLDVVLRPLGAKIEMNDGFLSVDLKGLEPRHFKAIKGILYGLLNACEGDHFIKIKNLPFCAMPDAWDHIVHDVQRLPQQHRLDICAVCKFYSTCIGVQKAWFAERDELRAVPDAPLDIAIEVNKKCNLECRYCSQDSRSSAADLPLRTIRRVLDEAVGLGIKNVRITGGEPLLRTDIISILRHAKDKELTVFLNTNATLLTDSLIKDLEGCVDNLLISLGGYNAYTENLLNSRGSLFKKKIENIHKLRRSKVPVLRVGTVVSKLLLMRFASYAELVRALRINIWEFYRPMVSFRQQRASSYSEMDLRAYGRLLRHIKTLAAAGVRAYIANAFPFCCVKHSQDRVFLRGARFDDGHSRLVLDAEGFFKPSYFIEKNLGTTIEAAWRHPFIKKINSFRGLPARCAACSYINWCCGGSRYLAKVHNGDYFSADPFLA